MKKLAMLILSAALVACGDSASKFEGQWLETSHGTSQLDIKKNGDAYVIRASNPKKPGESPAAPVPAVLKDGKLVLENTGSPAAFTYVKDSDSIVFASEVGNEEYRRVKQ